MLLKLTNAGYRTDSMSQKIYDPVYVVAAKICDIRTTLTPGGETLVCFDHGGNVLVKESQELVAEMLVEVMRPSRPRHSPSGCPDCGSEFLIPHKPDCPRINPLKLD